jgi:outer membrane protein OmpA-like peptidoglycan-associated protein
MATLQLTHAEARTPHRLRIGEPHVVKVLAARRVRLAGMFFDLNKCFLLPSAMKGIREVKRQYDRHPAGSLLVVGHTDTSGKDDYNLALSLERADAVAAYLTDQVEAWEKFFGHASPEKRWGMREIQHMLSALPEGEAPYFQGLPTGAQDARTTAAIKAFQQDQGLEVDGIAGPKTRKALIGAYMALDGTSLPAGISLVTHGCGENFPAASAEDGVRSPDDRRVEAFLFDGDIEPPPPGKTSKKGSTEYPRWLSQVAHTVDFSGEGEEEEALDCRFDFVLHSEAEEAPFANAPFKVELAAGEFLEGSTDGAGAFRKEGVAPGDYRLEIAGITMTIPALGKDEDARELLVRPDGTGA